jgi:hypothetical protein
MRVCFVVTPAAWELAKKTGALSIKPEATPRSVEWLRKQMQVRLPNFSGLGPMIVWKDISASDRELHGNSGDEMVYLEAEIPESRLLPMHYMSWELTVQLGQYLTLPEPEDIAIEERGPTEEEVENSWERIFQLEKMQEFIPDDTVVCAVDIIYLTEITKFEPFKVDPVDLKWADFQQDVAIPHGDPRMNAEVQSLMYPARSN